jgi:hypothetical protein
MLATEHIGAAHDLAGWRVAAVVLRYFVAVHLAQTLARTHQLCRSQHVREVTVNVGASGLVVAQSSLEGTTALRIPTTPRTRCGFSPCGYQDLGAWGPYEWWLRRAPSPRPQRLSSRPPSDGGAEPWPSACKLAAGSTSPVAEPPRGAVGSPRCRMVSGSLPYFSGVRTSSFRTTNEVLVNEGLSR